MVDEFCGESGEKRWWKGFWGGMKQRQTDLRRFWWKGNGEKSLLGKLWWMGVEKN